MTLLIISLIAITQSSNNISYSKINVDTMRKRTKLNFEELFNIFRYTLFQSVFT